ncbi:MAG: DUF1540 domain-containing protein [Clostridia bacterium]|nr:DUF1540 domain-containing protein [Clostridia bacterium]
MEKNQKINCTVESCIYQDDESKMCTLKSIHVKPVLGNGSKNKDESMCGSYECD